MTENGSGRRAPRRPTSTGRGVPSPEAPTVAFFAAFLGGILTLVEALALLAGGTEPVSVIGAPSSAELPSLGGVGVAVGIALLATGFALQENPAQRVGAGIALVVLGGLGLLAGGGFLAGSGLAVAGGLFAILRAPMPLYAAGGRVGTADPEGPR